METTSTGTKGDKTENGKVDTEVASPANQATTLSQQTELSQEQHVQENTEQPATSAGSSSELPKRQTQEEALQDRLTLLAECRPLTPQQQEALSQEVKDYEKSAKFQNKITEVREKIPKGQHVGILTYLQKNVLLPSYKSILDLGAGAGIMIQSVEQHYYDEAKKQHPESANVTTSLTSVVGVELVNGWVDFAKTYPHFVERNIHVYQGDVTNFTLPSPYSTATFDFVMLNDVMEHVMPERFGCFTTQLQRVTHTDSVVYMHTPTPQTQIMESNQQGQYFENIVPHHLLISKMATAGFELVSFEIDTETVCGVKKRAPNTPLLVDRSNCKIPDGWAKYYHAVFHRSRPRHRAGLVGRRRRQL